MYLSAVPVGLTEHLTIIAPECEQEKQPKNWSFEELKLIGSKVNRVLTCKPIVDTLQTSIIQLMA